MTLNEVYQVNQVHYTLNPSPRTPTMNASRLDNDIIKTNRITETTIQIDNINGYTTVKNNTMLHRDTVAKIIFSLVCCLVLFVLALVAEACTLTGRTCMIR